MHAAKGLGSRRNTIRGLVFAALYCRSGHQRELIMHELTITQNSALYLAQHRIIKRRNAVFRRMRAAGRDRPPDLLRPAFSEAYLVPRFYQDNSL